MNDAMAMYNTPISDNEVNLIDLIAEHIKQTINEESASIFLNNLNIATVHNLNPVVQRITINKYFNSTLLVYAALTLTDVNDILQFTGNDGLNEDWVTLVKEYIMPFLAKNDVIKTTYLFEIGE